MPPEVVAEDLLIIESIGDQALNLFLDGPIEIFERIHNNPFLLAPISILQDLREALDFLIRPLLPETDFLDQLRELLQSLRLQVLDTFDILVLYEKFVHLVRKLPQALVDDMLDLEGIA